MHGMRNSSILEMHPILHEESKVKVHTNQEKPVSHIQTPLPVDTLFRGFYMK